MKTWKRVTILGVLLAVIVIITLGVMMGMTKERILRVEIAGKEREYHIKRSYMADTYNRIMYEGSLYREFVARHNGDDRATLLMLSGDFEAVLRDIDANVQDKVESRVEFINSEDKLFEYHLGKDGVKVKDDKCKVLLDAIDSKSVATGLYDVDKALSVDELKRQTSLIGSYKTRYETSSKERRANIHLAANYINGSIVMPNMQFSFNNIVGERTKERGFEEANVIVNGEYVKGYGGGVCQVSTTLYNAWVLSGNDVIYATAHSLPPHYVELSRDAMVSSYNDMILINNSKTPIYVRSINDNDSIEFRIYGMQSDVHYDIISEVVETLPIENKYLGDVNEGEEYEEIVVSSGVPGYRSKGYLVTYDNSGKEQSRKLIREDVYKAQPRIIERVRLS